MALKREDISGKIDTIDVRISVDDVITFIEEQIDAFLRTAPAKGKRIVIDLSELRSEDSDDWLDILQDRYAEAGWEVKVDTEEEQLILF